MTNFNRRSFHGHHGSKHRELAQHSHLDHEDRPTLLQPLCAKRQLSYYIILNRILFEGTWGK